MTRSDLMLAVERLAETDKNGGYDEKTILLLTMLQKIENVYKIVFELQEDKVFKGFAGLIRKALEK